MKKLYEIKINAIAYAIGETSLDAQNAFEEEVTISHLRGIIETTDAIEVESLADPMWEKEYPYGTNKKDPQLICGDWIKLIKLKKETEARKKEFEARQRKLWEKP